MDKRALLAIAVLCGGCASHDDSPRDAGAPGKTGTVHFPVSCRDIGSEEFDSAVALLHSFFYEESRRRFAEFAGRDPECAMAWWGIAMTYYHPLWAPPTGEEMKLGAEAADRAVRAGGKTDVERGFIAAIEAYYRAPESAGAGPAAETCHGARTDSSRAAAYGRKMEELHRAFPDNDEVTAFYALSLLGTAPPTDKRYVNQLAAAEILEKLFAKNPDHPGVVHYLIHAYDYPMLAERRLPAARRYAELAPWVPHARHMPSHIFTRLGMWPEAIRADLAAIEASKAYMARWHPGVTLADELHSLDYLTFAYLQTCRDRQALEIAASLESIRDIHPRGDMPSAHALAAIPVRCVLERGRWEEASHLELRSGADLVRAFPFAEAHVEFAHAVGAGHLRDAATARRAADRLAVLRDAAKEKKLQFWVSQIEIQRLAASAWASRAEGKDEEAVTLLRQAAELEESAGTHPVTPGAVLPAREQLGDLLRDLGRPAEALPEYEAALASFPNRFRGHFGAGRAAELAGKPDVARKHYEQVLAMCEGGDEGREELAVVRAFLTKGR